MKAFPERVDTARLDQDSCHSVFEVAVRAAGGGCDYRESATQRLEKGDTELLLCACTSVEASRRSRP